ALGGSPKQVGVNLPPAANPIWSPDSRQLLVYTVNPLAKDDGAWGIVPLKGEAMRTDAIAILRSHGIETGPPMRVRSSGRKTGSSFQLKREIRATFGRGRSVG